jgi:hypothetical protein
MNKQAIKGITLFLLVLLFVPYVGIAQDSKKEFKPTVVISEKMVPLAQMGHYVELSNMYWAPTCEDQCAARKTSHQ